MNLRDISQKLEAEVSKLFEELRSGISAREDSRAFGAMVGHRIKLHWRDICARRGFEPVDLPGRRTVFDFGFKVEERIVGIDVKTKDLDTTKYSDGGICAVGNLLKFLANDRGQFIIAEFGHNQSAAKSDRRELEYIRVAPFTALPVNAYRIENLGTGQVPLNYTNRMICADLLGVLREGGSPLVLTERAGHLDLLAERLANLFIHATGSPSPEAEGAARARSASEAFLYRRLQTLEETAGRFRLNTELPIPFDNRGVMEVDLFCADVGVAIELDGAQHLADADAYRRDRRKDTLLQRHGCFVLRFLAEDLGKQLDQVLDVILAALSRRRSRQTFAESPHGPSTVQRDHEPFQTL